MTRQYKKLPVTMKMWMQFNVMPRTLDKVEILDILDSSDHHMVRWTTLVDLDQVEYQGTIKDYNKAEFDAIRNQIAHVDWNLTLIGDANQSWTEFKAIT